MKILNILLIAMAVFAFSCNNDAPNNQVDLGPAPSPINPSAIQATPGAPGAVATAVSHYTCPNNCAGSGGAQQGACPVCGTAYIHNQAFHNQPGMTPANNNPINIGNQQQPAQQQPAPAANSAGVFHYTCNNGCAGGAGTAGVCTTCGQQLAHNQAYHNAPAGNAGVPAQGGQKSPLYINNN